MNFDENSAANTAKGIFIASQHLLKSLQSILESGVPTKALNGTVSPEVLGRVCGSAVLGGLSIEVALKALVKKELGTAARGHEHDSLFEKLPPETQNRIVARFNKARAAHNRDNKSKIEQSLPEILGATKHCFEQWRYLYEKEGTETSFPAKAAELVFQAVMDEFMQPSKAPN